MADILVVEDSTTMREIFCNLLNSFNRTSRCAAGAAAARDLLEDFTPKAIFLDWDLPGFGALEVLRHVASMGEERPQIVLCTTVHDERELRLARAAGATETLMKPFNREGVERVLMQLSLYDGAGPDTAGQAAAREASAYAGH